MSKDINNKNWFKCHKVLSIIGVVLAFIIIASVAGGGSKTPTDSTSSTNSTNSSNTEEKTDFKIAETANIDDRKLTVNSIERNYSTGNEYLKPEAGKEFVVVTITIENNGKDSINFNTFDFKMQDSNGVQLTEDFSAVSDGKLNSGSLAAGGKVTGKIAYQVPQDDKGLKLLFTNPNLFNNKTITFSL